MYILDNRIFYNSRCAVYYWTPYESPFLPKYLGNREALALANTTDYLLVLGKLRIGLITAVVGSPR